MMKILIADKLPDAGLQLLKRGGMTVHFDPKLEGDALVEALKATKPAVLVVRSTKVNSAMLHASDTLSLVIRAGAGVNTIDVTEASKLGIFVANCPGKNAVAVAELTLGLILSLDRRIPDNVAQVRMGKWNKKEFSKAKGLKGKTLGLIGVGNIGREVIQRAKAFEMLVTAWSRSLTDARAAELGIGRAASPKEVAQRADIVSVHVALTDDTRGLCNRELFESMKEGAFFINTSRAEVVDERALLAAMEERGIRAGLDVLSDEPSFGTGEWQSALATHPNVTCTHHIGASTEQAQAAIADEALRILTTYAETGIVFNCVNLDQNPEKQCLLTVRHLNRVGVLAKLLAGIQKENINVLVMDNSLFDGDEAAIARIALSTIPSPETLERMAAQDPAIISITVINRSTRDSTVA